MNEDIEKLVAMYEQSSMDIIGVIQSISGGLTKRRQLELLKQIGVIISITQGDATGIILEIIEAAYKEGSNEATEELRAQGVKNIEASFKAGIHREAVQNIADDMFYTVLEASDNMSQDAKDRLEMITTKANQRSLIEGQTRREATKKAVAEATAKGITGAIYKNGAKVPVEKYLANTIQYYQRRAHVDGSINRMTENNKDLLYVNSVGITCSLCAQYQGRVYSISGKDSRFPPLTNRPPYHGHCVHSAYLWSEEFQDPKDIADMLQTSNRPFEDNRSEAKIRKYDEMQRKASRKNETRKQWIRYKSRMPDLPDLKTFGSQKARNTKKYKKWQQNFQLFGLIIKEGG
ncbi:minor capsid protein [Jeotgalibacillus sp. ET6]|uniref:phage minor capsid protein n=1 Tax=Jeotgalibacillus sp. ET6 TaxID=3037260 RepID=UPI00241838EE|nr:phage minor capsid protein [Jeotgalibacillus sp. ET6]MDG5470521.1 minor capsid protein [Jeotgalibacillus sp. ET6]